ncbi:MAG: hypothetical protein K1X67_11005 [Fimbriimonadaceae bacterium]|nr:hypothetical protein [Fimbriimonadaceae bacterium]
MKQFWKLSLLLAVGLIMVGCKEDTGETTQSDINGNVAEMTRDESKKIKEGEVKNDAILMGGPPPQGGK